MHLMMLILRADVGADICLAGGSDKTVQVYDMNAARCIRLMTDVHTRAVHHIAQNHVRSLLTHDTTRALKVLIPPSHSCLLCLQCMSGVV